MRTATYERGQRQLLDRPVGERQDAGRDDGRQLVGRLPLVPEAGKRDVGPELAVAPVVHEEEPRVLSAGGNAQERRRVDVHLVDAREGLVARRADGDLEGSDPARLEAMPVARPEPDVPELVGERLAGVGEDRGGVVLLVPDAEGRVPFVARALVERPRQGEVLLEPPQLGRLVLNRLIREPRDPVFGADRVSCRAPGSRGSGTPPGPIPAAPRGTGHTPPGGGRRAVARAGEGPERRGARRRRRPTSRSPSTRPRPARSPDRRRSRRWPARAGAPPRGRAATSSRSRRAAART